MQIVRGAGSPLGRHVRSIITFDGTAGGGASGTAVTVFTITGRVLITVFVAYCATDLVGDSATVSVGMASNVDKLMAVTTATDLDEDEWWMNTSPAAGGLNLMRPASSPANAGQQMLTCSENIIVNPLQANVTGGVIDFDCWYEPITDNGVLV